MLPLSPEAYHYADRAYQSIAANQLDVAEQSARAALGKQPRRRRADPGAPSRDDRDALAQSCPTIL